MTPDPTERERRIEAAIADLSSAEYAPRIIDRPVTDWTATHAEAIRTLAKEALALMREPAPARAHSDEALLSVQIAQECNRLASGYSAAYVINSIRGIVEGHPASALPVPQPAPDSTALREAAQAVLDGGVQNVTDRNAGNGEVRILTTRAKVDNLRAALSARPEPPAAGDAKLLAFNQWMMDGGAEVKVAGVLHTSEDKIMAKLAELLASPAPADAEAKIDAMLLANISAAFAEAGCPPHGTFVEKIRDLATEIAALRQQVADLTKQLADSKVFAGVVLRRDEKDAEIARLRALKINVESKDAALRAADAECGHLRASLEQARAEQGAVRCSECGRPMPVLLAHCCEQPSPPEAQEDAAIMSLVQCNYDSEDFKSQVVNAIDSLDDRVRRLEQGGNP